MLSQVSLNKRFLTQHLFALKTPIKIQNKRSTLLRHWLVAEAEQNSFVYYYKVCNHLE
jgi:hypothetical protein